MGTYLATGIIAKMSIQQKEMEYRKTTLPKVEEALRKELNLDAYFLSENETTVFWTINPQMLEGNFPEFFETQLRMYDETKEQDIQQAIAKIRDAATGEDIIKLATGNSLRKFQMLDYLQDSLEVKQQDSFSTYVTVNYHMIAFFIDGKIVMECYKNILRYFERNIRLQKEKYPVVMCLKAMITS